MQLEISEERSQISAKAAFPPRLQLAFETLATTLGNFLGADDVSTGDPVFDRAVRVGAAEPAAALAVLGSGERNELVPLLRRGAIVRKSEIRLTSTPPLVDEDDIVEVAERMAWLALRLAVRPNEVPARLFDNTYDPVAGVRLRCLKALLDRYPTQDETARAARFGVNDADPDVLRTAAFARQSGERGAEALLAMATNATLSRADLMAALQGFLERAPPSRVVEEVCAQARMSLDTGILEKALETARPQARPALEALRARQDLPDAIGNAVRRALARITGKTAGGAVSISEPAGGAVSVADDRGRVSIVSTTKRGPKKTQQ